MASRRFPPTAWWWLALVVVPLLLVGADLAVGRSAPDPSWGSLSAVGSAPASSSSSTPATAPSRLEPISLLRSGPSLTVAARVPNSRAAIALIAAVRGAVGADVRVRDQVEVSAGAAEPDVTGVARLAAAGVGDFSYDFDGTAWTLMGTAPTEQARRQVGQVASAVVPGAAVSNQLQIYAGPPPDRRCLDIGTRVASVMTHGRVTFRTDMATLDATARRTLAHVAELVRSCPAAHLLVTGYADTTGTDAVNDPLSRARARQVAEQLVANGVHPGQVSTRGLGSRHPVASNATVAGRAENRRAEVQVR